MTSYMGVRLMRDLMAVVKALADENRVRILMAVAPQELCVCQIVELLGSGSLDRLEAHGDPQTGPIGG